MPGTTSKTTCNRQRPQVVDAGPSLTNSLASEEVAAPTSASPEWLSDSLAIEVTVSSVGSIVRLRGEADMSSGPALVRRLLEVPGSRITVDLAEISFIDAAGLGALVVAQRELRGAGRQMALVAPHPLVARVFHVAGLQHLLASPAR